MAKLQLYVQQSSRVQLCIAYKKRDGLSECSAVQIYFFPDFVQPSHGLLLMKVMAFDTACDAIHVYGWTDYGTVSSGVCIIECAVYLIVERLGSEETWLLFSL